MRLSSGFASTRNDPGKPAGKRAGLSKITRIINDLRIYGKHRMKALTALSDFEHGFVIAEALAARLGDPNLAAKMLGNAGFKRWIARN